MTGEGRSGLAVWVLRRIEKGLGAIVLQTPRIIVRRRRWVAERGADGSGSYSVFA